MDKIILKNIAKHWCKSILLANDTTSFEDVEDILSQEEIHYIQEESHRIANRIIDGDRMSSMQEIVKKYYDF
ncbi:hypothetical protein [Aquimarina macrocephali]|uniref:hypothetical protein n=1 Tax=Aquimarina macrocephali TaxID=666563 RepID=UPI003F67A97D